MGDSSPRVSTLDGAYHQMGSQRWPGLGITRLAVYVFRPLYWKAMETAIDIGTLISRSPGVVGGRPCIAGTRVSVRGIALQGNAGLSPEEIVGALGGHVSLAQVHAALAYYFANKAEIDSDMDEEERLALEFEKQYQA
jgi:uncharacterized protein (DUF433 family)